MHVIGTAGHVDHGKSTLVHRLTGIDPDRLGEEKARGMTIDLGFAWLRLPGGEDVSIVDVPGHERFIKNMLAGVGGIDLALLIVAADEGVMPQTREHLQIIDLLGIAAGVVAITKSELVDQDWLDLVRADIEETVAHSSIAGAPIVACSAQTGEGLPELLRTIEERLASVPPKRDIGRPRLAIDRAFTVSGFGTVVTGTLIDGSLKIGQEVEILPGDARTRIRGLQTHRQKVETARPGSRVAVNLAGVAVHDLSRGQVLTNSGWLRPATAIDTSLTAVASLDRPLRHNLSATFYSGAAEVQAKVRLLDRTELDPGEQGWAQIRMVEPVAVAVGDRFVLRSPNETLAGGTIVDARAKRHRRGDPAVLTTLSMLAQGSPADAVFALIDRAQPVEYGALLRQADGGEERVRPALDSLTSAGRVAVLAASANPSAKDVLFTTPGLERLWERAEDALSGYFREHQLRSAMPKEELRSRLGLTARVFTLVLNHWTAQALLVERDTAVVPPGHAVSLTSMQETAVRTYISSLKADRFSPTPGAPLDAELLAYLIGSGEVIAVGDGIVFAADAYAEMVERIQAYLREHGTITLAQVRDMFGGSRKYAQALLEQLDQRRITRRVGDERVLVSP